MSYIDDAIARLEQEGAKPQEISNAPPKKTMFEEYAPLAGSIIGGLGALAVTKNPATLIQAGQSALGTGLGTSIGMSASQLSRQLGGEDIPISQLLKEQGKEVGTQVAADVAGSTIGAGLLKGYSTLKPAKQVDPIIKKAQEEMQKRGTTLSVGQVAPNTWRSTVENATYQTIGGKLRLNTLFEQQDKVLKQMREELTPIAHSLPISNVGEAVKEAINGGFSGLSKVVEPIYQDIGQRAAAKNIFVDTMPVQKIAKDILAQQDRIGKVGLTEQGGTILQRVASGDNTLTFQDAQALRSSLLARGRMLEEGDPAKRNIKLLVDQVTKQMEDGAKQAGPDVYSDLMKVNAFYRKSQGKLNDDFVAKVVAKQPSQVVDSIVSSGNEKEISMLKVALKRAEGLGSGVKYDEVWGNVQQHYIDNLLNQSGKLSKEGETIGSSLLKNFTDPKSLRTMKRVLSDEQISNIKTFAETSLIAQKKPKGQNSWLIPMMQAGVISDLVYFNFLNPYTDAAIIFSPLALGKMLTNPERANRLVGAMKRQGVPPSPALMTKITADITWANNEVEKEKKSSDEEELMNWAKGLK